MGKRKTYQVCLVSPGVLDKNLHYGPFFQNWWKTRCINNTNRISNLYPIRINMKILVILQNIHFIVTVIQDHSSSLQQSEYICEVENSKSNIFNNSLDAITTLYQKLFNNNTKFSGPLIMDYNKIEISEQLLVEVTFRPFCYFLRKFWLFIYGIGVSSKEQFYYAGLGFKSSFIYSIRKNRKRTLFTQEINKKNLIIKMYQDFELQFTYINNNPNDMWKKVGIL